MQTRRFRKTTATWLLAVVGAVALTVGVPSVAAQMDQGEEEEHLQTIFDGDTGSVDPLAGWRALFTVVAATWDLARDTEGGLVPPQECEETADCVDPTQAANRDRWFSFVDARASTVGGTCPSPCEEDPRTNPLGAPAWLTRYAGHAATGYMCGPAVCLDSFAVEYVGDMREYACGIADGPC